MSKSFHFPPIAALLLVLSSVLSTGHAQVMSRVTITSEPEGVEVWLVPENRPKVMVGRTPVNYLEVTPGRYDIHLNLEDHDSLTLSDVHVRAGQHVKIHQKLASRYGRLVVHTMPDSAEIFLNSLKVGISPYSNHMMLPGKYALRILPPSPLYRPSSAPIFIESGDSTLVKKRLAYREKSFGMQNLSLPPWWLQFETGFSFRDVNGFYDAEGGSRSFGSADSLMDPELRDTVLSRYMPGSKSAVADFPLTLRLAVPSGIEFHLHLPFKRIAPDSGDTFFGPSDLEIGAKFTLYEYNVGFDATYRFASGNAREGLGAGRNTLTLAALAMMAKDKFQGFGNAGVEFHFTDKNAPNFDFGEQIFLKARGGYIIDPWMPYLAAEGRIRLSDKENDNPLENGGQSVVGEAGIVVDVSETLALQAGIPFTVPVLAKRSLRYWGVHLSIAAGLQL